MHSEVLGELTDIVVEVSLFSLLLDPVLVSAHIEEALEGVRTSSIVWVHIVLFLSALRLLDVPENVIWELLEDLLSRSGG